MKTILISALTILIIVIGYFLFFTPGSAESTKGKNINVKFASNRPITDEMINNKLSMKQIDSITALENYNFTIQNYGKDVVPAQAAELKNKKL